MMRARGGVSGGNKERKRGIDSWLNLDSINMVLIIGI
jgi:hypothetical protein